MANILIYSEDANTASELVTAAGASSKGEAPQISVAVLGSDAVKKSDALALGGVSKIYLVQDDSLQDCVPEAVCDALEQISLDLKPDYILIGATKCGKEVAPRLAVRLKLGCITDAQGLELEGGHAKANRVVWGGNAVSEVRTSGGAVITIAPRAFERAKGTANVEKKSLDYTQKTRSSKVVSRKPRESGEVNIKDAEAVVSAGRGFKKKEDLAILDELATTLHAVIGASRPLTSDLAWMPESRQVGLSGTTVKPKLYVAVGISGQIQHLTGMRDSKIIVAINSDKNAPIFSECDYGIVGDLYVVVPALAKSLKAKSGR